jgi:hypothetical protein
MVRSYIHMPSGKNKQALKDQNLIKLYLPQISLVHGLYANHSGIKYLHIKTLICMILI